MKRSKKKGFVKARPPCAAATELRSPRQHPLSFSTALPLAHTLLPPPCVSLVVSVVTRCVWWWSDLLLWLLPWTLRAQRTASWENIEQTRANGENLFFNLIKRLLQIPKSQRNNHKTTSTSNFTSHHGNNKQIFCYVVVLWVFVCVVSIWFCFEYLLDTCFYIEDIFSSCLYFVYFSVCFRCSALISQGHRTFVLNAAVSCCALHLARNPAEGFVWQFVYRLPCVVGQTHLTTHKLRLVLPSCRKEKNKINQWDRNRSEMKARGA